MKWLRRAILAAGCATLGYLVYKFNPSVILSQIRLFGIGFAVIIPLQICDHSFNSMGWRFSFGAKDAAAASFGGLLLGRVAGDGVNYLTPSASIAGEVIRPSMLGGTVSSQAKNASVFVAKFAQAIGLMLFLLLGSLFLLQTNASFLTPARRISIAGVTLIIMLILLMALRLSAAGTPRFLGLRWKGMKQEIADYLRLHPGRFSVSCLCFASGYAWGSAEAFLICHFLGLAISPRIAVSIEVLSNVVDSLLFMVPAKIGTQEAGKIFIFRWLGYPAAKGMAFALVRHIRELFWASLGLLVYALKRQERQLRRPDQCGTSLKPRATSDL